MCTHLVSNLQQAYLARIEEVNLQGPELRAVIEKNPMALAIARALDIERYVSGPRGPLHGIPIIVKDNIATVAGEGKTLVALLCCASWLTTDLQE